MLFLLTKIEPCKDNVIGEIFEIKNRNYRPNNLKIVEEMFEQFFPLIMDLIDIDPEKRINPLLLLESGFFEINQDDKITI